MAEKNEDTKTTETEESVKEIYDKKNVKDEEFFEAKKDKKSLFNRIMNIILWVVLIVWMAICLIDFYNAKTKKEPIFCLKRETVNYNDGTVDTCTGLGYKIFNYKRKSFKGIEYGPFWAKDRTAEKEVEK